MSRGFYAVATIALSLLWGGPSQAAVNVALSANGGVASQSSSGSAANCNDGTTAGNSNWCHTFLDSSPWWQVQLSGDFLIDNVVIWNRTDCCSDRIGNFTVTIFDDATEIWSQSHTYTEFSSIDATHLKLDIDVAEGISGDRVRITIVPPFTSSGNPDNFQWLNLAEVEVFQDETSSIPEPATLALVGLGLFSLGFVRRRRAH